MTHCSQLLLPVSDLIEMGAILPNQPRHDWVTHNCIEGHFSLELRRMIESSFFHGLSSDSIAHDRETTVPR